MSCSLPMSIFARKYSLVMSRNGWLCSLVMKTFINKSFFSKKMINKSLLRAVVVKQKTELPLQTKFVKRELLDEILSWFRDNRVIILTGLRRSGKSTLLGELMQNLSGWCYVNFEDERFLDFKAQDFEILNEVLTESYGPAKIYFFDEIQNIEKFETFVRRLQDEGKKIVITGSNASLLSKEFGTRLTGRHKLFEVYPFSFKEFLRFKDITVGKNDFYMLDKKINLIKQFEEYLFTGGLPEYLQNKDKEYVRAIYENILYKDVIVRYAIRRPRVVKELINILSTNISSSITYNALKQTLGLGNAITVKEYISYLNSAYLFFELARFSYSVKQQLNSPKKVYLIDPAFNQVCGENFSQNKGKLLENLVFIELKRKKKDLFYYFLKHECDFIVKEWTKITEAIQVCYELNDENREREIVGLLEAMDAFKLKEGLILTLEQEEEIIKNGKKIQVIPVFKWLLETK